MALPYSSVVGVSAPAQLRPHREKHLHEFIEKIHKNGFFSVIFLWRKKLSIEMAHEDLFQRSSFKSFLVSLESDVFLPPLAILRAVSSGRLAFR